MDLLQRLKALNPLIEDVMRITGSVGLSVGIVHESQIVYTANFGFRDIGNRLPPNDETLYYIASRTKFMTGAAIAVLVEEGKLSWDTLVKDALPDFQHPDKEISEKATIADILSHRSGLTANMAYWMGEHCRLTIPETDFVKTATILERIHELRSTFLYNNWGSGLGGMIVQRHSGLSLGTFLNQRFFEPLGLSRTTLEVNPKWKNVAEPYLWSGDEDHPLHVAKVPVGDGQMMAGAMGGKSTVKDLIAFYKSYMLAFHDQTTRNATSTAGNPFKQAVKLAEPQISLTKTADVPSQDTYTLGWVRAQLPAKMSHVITPNAMFKSHPLVGKGLEHPPEIFYHFGSLVGYLGSTILIPGSNSIILVETNTLGNSDGANWIGSMILEAFLDVPAEARNDYRKLAEDARAAQAEQFPKMLKAFEEGRRTNASIRPLSEYVGKYYNAVGTYYLDIYEEGGSLWMCRGGDKREVDSVYQLQQYSDDVFSWAMDYTESCRRGLWPNPTLGFYLLNFTPESKEGPIDRIVWRHSPSVPEGEVMLRNTYGSRPGQM